MTIPDLQTKQYTHTYHNNFKISRPCLLNISLRNHLLLFFPIDFAPNSSPSFNNKYTVDQNQQKNTHDVCTKDKFLTIKRSIIIHFHHYIRDLINLRRKKNSFFKSSSTKKYKPIPSKAML